MNLWLFFVLNFHFVFSFPNLIQFSFSHSPQAMIRCGKRGHHHPTCNIEFPWKNMCGSQTHILGFDCKCINELFWTSIFRAGCCVYALHKPELYLLAKAIVFFSFRILIGLHTLHKWIVCVRLFRFRWSANFVFNFFSLCAKLDKISLLVFPAPPICISILYANYTLIKRVEKLFT